MENYEKRCYYLKDEKPTVAICLFSNNGTVLSRGIAILDRNMLPWSNEGEKEKAAIVQGENQARFYSELALNERRNMCLIDNDDELVALMEVLDDETNFVKEDGMYRGIFRPVLTRYEEELLGRCRR